MILSLLIHSFLQHPVTGQIIGAANLANNDTAKSTFTGKSKNVSPGMQWPLVTGCETRPWTWWWWHGGAFTRADITAGLEDLQRSGIGGVNIVCLLDVKDAQIDKHCFLSPEWMEAIVHTKREARRLGMDVDISPVNGWAFGGPWVSLQESSAVVEIKRWSNINTVITARELSLLIPDLPLDKLDIMRISSKISGRREDFNFCSLQKMEIDAAPDQLSILMAEVRFATDGSFRNVTEEVKKIVADQVWRGKDVIMLEDHQDLNALVFITEDGKTLDITREIFSDKDDAYDDKQIKGIWYAVLTRPGSSRVRMSSPDQGGWVVNHLVEKAVQNYFKPFDQVFKRWPAEDLPRAFNNDSWEINLNWSTNFLEEFEKRRGYNLNMHLPAFLGEGNATVACRVACDYRHTLSDLLKDHFTLTFKEWAVGHGGKIIGEVQDEPANEIDINSFYDIPQADMGGPRDWFIEKGDYATDHFFRRCKIPASAAHILGKSLVSSETFTCMGPILNTPFLLMKEKADYDMVAGVNHTMFHGISYSPQDAPWPGWLFYAGTHLGQFNPMWHQQGKQFCSYITRCQSFLQKGVPDNDILVYYPIFDLWSKPPSGTYAGPGYVRMDAGPAIADTLWRNGYDFDFISDTQLNLLRVEQGKLVSPGSSHKALVIGGCKWIPCTTMEKIIHLVKEGGTVVMHGDWPENVPGMANLTEQTNRLDKALVLLEKVKQDAGNNRTVRLGNGRIIFGDQIMKCMTHSGILREEMTDLGLRYVRRRNDNDTYYFITNPAENKRVDGWIPISSSGSSVAIFDPLSGEIGYADFQKSENGCQVRLQLEPLESYVICVMPSAPDDQQDWTYHIADGKPVELRGNWDVEFLEGGEVLPHAEKVDALNSWTEWKSDQEDALRYFSGIARYTLRFSSPSALPDGWMIELEEVCHTARVKLNGKLLGNILSGHGQVFVQALFEKGENVLEIEVANAPINRAAYLDIREIDWQKTLGENERSFMLGDFLFPWEKKDRNWTPCPSGLTGSVRLIPVKLE